MKKTAIRVLVVAVLTVSTAACQTDGQDQLSTGPSAPPLTYGDYAADHDVVFARIAPDGSRFVTLSADVSGGEAVEWLHFWNGDAPHALHSRYRLSRWAGGRRTANDIQDEFAFLADGSGYILGHKNYHDKDRGHEYERATIRDWIGNVRHRIDLDRFDGMDFVAGCGIAVHPTEPQAALCLINRVFETTHSKVVLVDVNSGKVLRHGTLKMPDSSPTDDLSFSPDGRYFTFRAAMKGSKAKWAAVADATSLTLSPSHKRRDHIAFDPGMKWRYEIDEEKKALTLMVFAATGTSSLATKPVAGSLMAPGPAGQVATVNGKDGGISVVIEPEQGRAEFVESRSFTLGGDVRAIAAIPRTGRWMIVTTKGAETRKLLTDAEIAGLHAHAEARKLAQAGIWDVMAEKWRQGIAALPTEIGSGTWDGRGLAMVAKANHRDDYPMTLFGRLQVELLDAMMAAIPRNAMFGLSIADHSVAIKTVNGPVAEAAGLQVGDRILSVDGRTVTPGDVVKVLAAAPTNRPVALQVERAGKPFTVMATASRELGDGRGNYFMKLSDYALMASEAGHPALVMMAVERMRQLMRDNPNGWAKDKLEPFIAAHEVLALAGFGKLDEAYALAARTGAMKAVTIKVNIQASPGAFWSLLGDRSKMAYLLGIAEKDLPQRGARPRAYPFPDLSGTVIQPPTMDGSFTAPSVAGAGSTSADPASLGWQVGPSGVPATLPATMPAPVQTTPSGGVIILE